MLGTDNLAKTELSRNKDLYVLTDSDIKNIQSVVLEMAKDIADICEKNNIPYLLGGGSALGAYRHKGFIPWDDDIDINVRRCDIDRLMTLISEIYGEKYRVMGPEITSGFFSSFYEVQRKGTVFREFLYQKDDDCGIKIDIYPMENTYDHIIPRAIHGIGVNAGLFLLSCIRIYWHMEEWLPLARGNIKALTIIKTKAMIGRPFFKARWKWFSKVQKWIRHCMNDQSKFIVMPAGRKHFFGEIYSRKPYCDTVFTPFEDTEFRVSVANKEYLKQRYGDGYMNIPSEKERDRHVLHELRLN